jgi:hypothetical protein
MQRDNGNGYDEPDHDQDAERSDPFEGNLPEASAQLRHYLFREIDGSWEASGYTTFSAAEAVRIAAERRLVVIERRYEAHGDTVYWPKDNGQWEGEGSPTRVDGFRSGTGK